MNQEFDIIVVGAGIAGASAAYELSQTRRVLIVEAEDHPGVHATGRSAALFSEIYGCPEVRALSRASRSFFESPPAGFSGTELLRPRGSLFIANDRSVHKLDEMAADQDVARATRRLDAAAISRLVPIVAPEWSRAALYEPNSRDIEVNDLLHGYLRGFKARGGLFWLGCKFQEAEWNGRNWAASTTRGAATAPILVNAAGAWADEIAHACGVQRKGLRPLLRSVVTIAAPDASGAESWPMVVGADESFYFKPDAGRLLVSSAEEEESAACDAQPDELAVATAAHRFWEVTGIEVQRVLSRWAGLRTFARDRRPVIGFDPSDTNFFWLAGQGGYGVQTAPAAAQLAAQLINGGEVTREAAAEGLTTDSVSPARLCQLCNERLVASS